MGRDRRVQRKKKKRVESEVEEPVDYWFWDGRFEGDDD